MDKKPFIGLAGIIVAAMAAEFNEQVSAAALVDIRGALGISHDPGTWITSLYVSGEVVGMAVAPSLALGFTLRRAALGVLLLNVLSSVLIPFSPNLSIFYILRVLQGLAEGLTIPLLMTTALRVLAPPIRLYGLACYALTASFFPNLSTMVSALWTDLVNWRFVFFQSVPFCTLAAMLCWWGMPDDEPNWQRLSRFDWRGLFLVVTGFGSLITLLEQGGRLDWFNSDLICVLGLVSLVAVPLLVLNEWFAEVPLFKPQMLRKPNFAYGALTLLAFIVISQAGSTVPTMYLQEVQGYRPMQAFPIITLVGLLQLVFLPMMVLVLDIEWIDARWVNGLGLLAIMGACIGESLLNSAWDRNQFVWWQVLFGFGEAAVVMSLLMLATNAVKLPEAPFASSMVNAPRAVAEALGAWLIQLIGHLRGQLHSSRLLDSAGIRRFSVLQGPQVAPHQLPALLPDGMQRGMSSLALLDDRVRVQTEVLVISDVYLVMAAVAALLFVILCILPVHTDPPRIALAKK